MHSATIRPCFRRIVGTVIVRSEVWRANLPALARGSWHVELGGDRWRLAASVWMPASGGEAVLRALAPCA